MLRVSRLRVGELIAGAGAVVMTVVLFAPDWYGPGSPAAAARTGWEALTVGRWLLLITVLAALGLASTQAALRAPAIPVAMSMLVTVLAGVSALWLIYRVLLSPPAHERAGAYLELVAAAVTTVGGYLSLRREGISPRDAPQDIPTISLT